MNDIHHIGDNWYRLYEGGSSLEYNTGPNPTADLHADRDPQASVYRDIDGLKVIAKIHGHQEVCFYYNKTSFDQAYKLAKQFVIDQFQNQQNDIFVQ